MAEVKQGVVKQSIVPNAGLWFEWELDSQNTAHNRSSIKWRMRVVTNSSFRYDFTTPTVSSLVEINGVEYARTKQQIKIQKSMNAIVFEGTSDVEHDSVGTCTLNVEFTQSFQSDFGTTHVTTVTGTGTFELPRINRFAYIRQVSDFDDATTPIVGIMNPAKGDATQLTLGMYFVKDPENLYFERELGPKASATFNINFALTDEELNTIYSAMSDTSAEKVVFYIKSTIGDSSNNSEYPVYVYFRITDAQPTIDPVIEDTKDLTIELSRDENVIVLGESIVKAKINAVAVKGAAITYQNIYCGDKALTPLTSDPDWDWVINKPASGTFKIVVEDSRGNRIERDVVKNTLPYVVPTINIDYEKIVYESSPEVAHYKIKLSGNAFRTPMNLVSVMYRYKVNDGSWSTWVSTLLPADPGQTYYYEDDIGDQFSVNDLLSYQAIIVDILYDKGHDRRPPYDPKEGAIWTEKIGRIPLFDYGKSDFKFNVPVDLPGLTINGVSLDDYIRQIVESM